MTLQVMPMDVYLAIDALSSGACKALASQSPYAWCHRANAGSPALSLGTLAHLAILEPDDFSRAVVQPACDLRTNAGKEALVAWLVAIVGEPMTRPPGKASVGTVLDLYLADLRPRLAESGLVVLTEDQRALCLGMLDSVMGRRDIRELLAVPGQSEGVGLTIDAEYGIPVKVRPDRYLPDHNVILSLKTTQSVADRDYLRTAWQYGWHGAAWFYARVMERLTDQLHNYWEIAVESAPPHDVLLLEYTSREIREGETTMRRGMEQYRRCVEGNIWPGAGWDWDQNDYTIRAIGRRDNEV